MLRLYADEQFPLPAVKRLREKGYDILTVQDAGNDNQGIPDEDVLSFATSQDRAVITQNRKDFIRFHKKGLEHAGIVACSKNLNWDEFAVEIDRALATKDSIVGEVIRVNRPTQQ
jgi:predicted nuclease of predicted toxin-antitoxin system